MTGAVDRERRALFRRWVDRGLGRRSPSPQPAAPWVASGAGVSRRFTHPSGWVVAHCGHLTANHPWACYDPAGELHRSGDACNLGVAFDYLSDAIAHAEAHLAEEAP